MRAITRAEWVAQDQQLARAIARREAAERRQRARPSCAVCGGRMSAPRLARSTCQGDAIGLVRCGLSVSVAPAVASAAAPAVASSPAHARRHSPVPESA
jgi:hypothetical protein